MPHEPRNRFDETLKLAAFISAGVFISIVFIYPLLKHFVHVIRVYHGWTD